MGSTRAANCITIPISKDAPATTALVLSFLRLHGLEFVEGPSDITVPRHEARRMAVACINWCGEHGSRSDDSDGATLESTILEIGQVIGTAIDEAAPDLLDDLTMVRADLAMTEIFEGALDLR